MPMADRFICGQCRKPLTHELAVNGYIIRQCDNHPDVAPIGIVGNEEHSTEPFASKVGHEARSS
jgi:hypothetical protein